MQRCVMLDKAVYGCHFPLHIISRILSSVFWTDSKGEGFTDPLSGS